MSVRAVQILDKVPFRRIQYSLLSLIMFISVLGIGVAVMSNSARRQQRAIAALKARAPTCRVTYERSESKWLRTLLPEDYLDVIIEVRLDEQRISDADLVY